MNQAFQLATNWVEPGLVPDAVVRRGIWRLCERRVRDIDAGDCEAAALRTEALVCTWPPSPSCRSWPTGSTMRCRPSSSLKSSAHDASTAATGGRRASATSPKPRQWRWQPPPGTSTLRMASRCSSRPAFGARRRPGWPGAIRPVASLPCRSRTRRVDRRRRASHVVCAQSQLEV